MIVLAVLLDLKLQRNYSLEVSVVILAQQDLNRSRLEAKAGIAIRRR